MADGVTKLRQLQYGFEAVAGTAIVADTLLPADAAEENMIQDDRETIIVPVGDGNLVKPDTIIYVPKLTGTLELPSHPFGFELGNHIFQFGINAEAATQDGSGTGYIWEYEIGATGNAPQYATFYGGDNNSVERGNFGFAQAFTITGENEGAIMADGATIMVRDVEVDSFASLSAAANEIALMGNVKLYIDAVGDGFGTTQKSGTLHSFALNVNRTGFDPKPVGDGSLYYSSVKHTGINDGDVQLEITFEHEATASAERVAWRAKTTRAVRLIVEGSALGTPDVYTYKTFIIDFAGVYTEFGTLDDDDGDNIMVGTLELVNNATLATTCKITVVNELSTT